MSNQIKLESHGVSQGIAIATLELANIKNAKAVHKSSLTNLNKITINQFIRQWIVNLVPTRNKAKLHFLSSVILINVWNIICIAVRQLCNYMQQPFLTSILFDFLFKVGRRFCFCVLRFLIFAYWDVQLGRRRRKIYFDLIFRNVKFYSITRKMKMKIF